ncbi:hypothetical protein ACOSQ3_029508 [Xanthoceras sorbifolium]
MSMKFEAFSQEDDKLENQTLLSFPLHYLPQFSIFNFHRHLNFRTAARKGVGFAGKEKNNESEHFAVCFLHPLYTYS